MSLPPLPNTHTQSEIAQRMLIPLPWIIQQFVEQNKSSPTQISLTAVCGHFLATDHGTNHRAALSPLTAYLTSLRGILRVALCSLRLSAILCDSPWKACIFTVFLMFSKWPFPSTVWLCVCVFAVLGVAVCHGWVLICVFCQWIWSAMWPSFSGIKPSIPPLCLYPTWQTSSARYQLLKVRRSHHRWHLIVKSRQFSIPLTYHRAPYFVDGAYASKQQVLHVLCLPQQKWN